MLLKENLNVTENAVLESVNRIICPIKFYINTKKEPHFIYIRLSVIISYKKKLLRIKMYNY